MLESELTARCVGTVAAICSNKIACTSTTRRSLLSVLNCVTNTIDQRSADLIAPGPWHAAHSIGVGL
jgi:hypothetical protein